MKKVTTHCARRESVWLFFRIDLRFSLCVNPIHANKVFPVNCEEQEGGSFEGKALTLPSPKGLPRLYLIIALGGISPNPGRFAHRHSRQRKPTSW